MIGGRYALRSAMGSRGVGTVWRAYDQRRDHDVAIQEVVMPPGLTDTERHELCERSLREARIVANLRHPSVVPLCDVVMHGERPWVVMEFLEARSVHEIVRDDGPLPYAVVADIGLHVLGALESAHAAGILHRDVKPSNILVGRGSWAVLTGFAVARTSGDSAMTSAGLALCSSSFIPPERARGDEASPASDLWSLGAALFTAVEGQPPFDAGDPMPTLAAILGDDPVPTQRAGPLAPVLAGLLDKDPIRRWNLERARTGLRAVLAGADATLPTPEIQPSGTVPRQRSVPQGPARAGSPTPRAAQRRAAGASAHRRRVAITFAGGAVACVLVAALLVVTFARVGSIGAKAIPSASAGPQSPSSPSPAQSPTPSSSGAASSSPPVVPLPATYQHYVHPFGFSVDVPSDWRKEQRANGDTIFREPKRGRIVALQRVDKAAENMRDYWEAANTAQKGQPGYEFLGITTSKMAGRTGADWEFERRQGTGTDTNTHRTVGRGIMIDNTAYIVYLSTREGDFPGSEPILDRVSSSFKLSS